MYTRFIRPLLFLVPPETIHALIAKAIRFGFKVPGVQQLVRKIFTYQHPSLPRTVFGIRFETPIGLAAGFDKNAELHNELGALGFSFVEVGTVTPVAQPGNPKPRSFRLKRDSALINRMGFNNRGVQSARRNLERRSGALVIGGNIGKNTLTPNCLAPDDYLVCFRELYDCVDYFVVNISCPNVENLRDLQEIEGQRSILLPLLAHRALQPKSKPILLKVSPDLTTAQLDSTIDLAIELGLDGFVATNTTTQRVGLRTPPERVDAIGRGGLSGAPLTKRSTEVIRHIHARTGGELPIIGVGGIMSPADALEKLDAGASLIQLYTGFIYQGPWLAKRICKAIARQR